MDLVDELRKIEDDLRTKLERSNPDYQRLLVIQRAIRDIMNVEKWSPLGLRKVSPPQNNRIVSVTPVGVSQADAGYAILEASSEPLPVADLVPKVRMAGATVGGNNPEMNLSSSLSRDGRFTSVRYKGRACWAIKGRTYVTDTPVSGLGDHDRDLLQSEIEEED